MDSISLINFDLVDMHKMESSLRRARVEGTRISLKEPILFLFGKKFSSMPR